MNPKEDKLMKSKRRTREKGIEKNEKDRDDFVASIDVQISGTGNYGGVSSARPTRNKAELHVKTDGSD